VPYRLLAESRRYRPDFTVLVDDGKGQDDRCISRRDQGFQQAKDARVEKKETMDVYWVPVSKQFGKNTRRWRFAEFTDFGKSNLIFPTRWQLQFKQNDRTCWHLANFRKNWKMRDQEQ